MAPTAAIDCSARHSVPLQRGSGATGNSWLQRPIKPAKNWVEKSCNKFWKEIITHRPRRMKQNRRIAVFLGEKKSPKLLLRNILEAVTPGKQINSLLWSDPFRNFYDDLGRHPALHRPQFHPVFPTLGLSSVTSFEETSNSTSKTANSSKLPTSLKCPLPKVTVNYLHSKTLLLFLLWCV